MVRSAAVDRALNVQEFESLVETSSNIHHRERSIQTTYFIVLPGRWSPRSGETLHNNKTWLDPETCSIIIPEFEDCNCGYCRTQAKRRAEKEDVARSFEEILEEEYWSPKSKRGARTIPLRTERAVNIVSRYFQIFGDSNVSYSTLYRRVKIAAELTPGLDASRITPQVLRATAATFWSWQGMDPSSLKYLMGWKYLHTALYYIHRTGAGISQEMDRVLNSQFQLPPQYVQRPPTWAEYRSDLSTELIEVDSWTPSESSVPRHPRYVDEEEELVDLDILQDFTDDQDLPPLDEDVDVGDL